MKIVLFIFFMFFLMATANANTCVGAVGGGNWSAALTWTSCGGVAPTAADNVTLTSGSGNITIDAGAFARSLDCTGYTGTLTHTAAVTLTLGDATAGASNIALKLVSGMTYTLGNGATSAISFVSTSITQQTVDYAGKSAGNITFNGAGGKWALISGITQANAASNGTVTLTAGTLETDGISDNSSLTHSWGQFVDTGSTARVLTLGKSSINIGIGGAAVWDGNGGTNTTLNAGSSTITFTSTNPVFRPTAGQTFNNIVFNGMGPSDLRNAFICTHLTKTGVNNIADSMLIKSNITATTFTVTILASVLTVTSTSGINVTLTNFDATGSSGHIITFNTTSAGSAASFTKSSGSVSTDYLSLKDSTATGGATWYAGANSTNVSGNSGWIFTAPPGPTPSVGNGRFLEIL